MGDWKNFFTPEKVSEWEEWMQERTKGTDLAEWVPK